MGKHWPFLLLLAVVLLADTDAFKLQRLILTSSTSKRSCKHYETCNGVPVEGEPHLGVAGVAVRSGAEHDNKAASNSDSSRENEIPISSKICVCLAAVWFGCYLGSGGDLILLKWILGFFNVQIE